MKSGFHKALATAASGRDGIGQLCHERRSRWVNDPDRTSETISIKFSILFLLV